MAISNASNQIVKVNLIPGIIPSVLYLSQYDTGAGRPITFSVYDGSQAFTIPSGVSIAFEGTKPDGKGFSFTCSKSGNSALLTNYTNQMTALSGKIMCQLVFTNTSGGRVGSLPVLMVVSPAGINEDTVISDSDIEAIIAAQNQYAVLNAKLDMAISAATQDSEVQDIRVKADGTSATTAGNAVREQITDLKDAINRYVESVYGTDSIKAIKGVLIKEEGYTHNASGYWKGLILPLDVALVDDKITTLDYPLSGGSLFYAVLFFDNDLNFISGIQTTILAGGSIAKTDIPANTCFVGFNYGSSSDVYFRIKTNTNITRIKEIEETIESEIIEGAKYEIPLNFGKTSGYYNKDRGYTTYSGMQAAKVSAIEGDIFFLTSKNYYGMARAVFFDSNDQALLAIFNGGNTSLVENTRIVAPVNTAYILIQRYGTNDCFLWKGSLTGHLELLDSEVLDIKNVTTDSKTTDVPLTFESATGFYTKTGTFSTYEGVTVANVSVIAGDSYLLTSRDYYSCAMAVFFDSSDNFLEGIQEGSGATARKDYKITVPQGATKMMIQRIYAYRTILEKIIGIKAKSTTSVLNNKRITVIGDSITERNFTAATNWANYLADWTDAVVQNLGASGTGFIAGNNNPYHNRISRIDTPDIIGVALSFNDMSQTIADLTTAAETFFDDLITAYPTTPIICYVQSPWSAYHYGIEKSDQWVNTLKDICQTRGIPFYDDMYNGSALKPWIAGNRAIYYMNDGEGSTGAEDWVHPNSEGHKIIARHLYPKFVENLVATGLDYVI